MRHFALILPLLLLAACASDGPVRNEPDLRSAVQRPQANVPSGVQDIRGELAAQRATTQESMDVVLTRPNSISPEPATPWYTPIFDVLDVAAGLTKFLY